MGAELRLRTEGLDWREVHGRIVALAADGRELVVNPTGSLLWPLLLEGSDREQLGQCLVDAFGIEPAQAERDADAFVAALRARDLLEP